MAKDEIHELPLAIQQKNTSYFAGTFQGTNGLTFDPYPSVGQSRLPTMYPLVMTNIAIEIGHL